MLFIVCAWYHYTSNISTNSEHTHKDKTIEDTLRPKSRITMRENHSSVLVVLVEFLFMSFGCLVIQIRYAWLDWVLRWPLSYCFILFYSPHCNWSHIFWCCLTSIAIHHCLGWGHTSSNLYVWSLAFELMTECNWEWQKLTQLSDSDWNKETLIQQVFYLH